MTLLSLENVSVTRGAQRVLHDISLEIAEGEVVALIGPNGAGKTTLMRAALGLLPATGTSSVARLPARERAKAAAWLPQSRQISWPVRAETVIALGRIPYLPAGRALSPDDRNSIDKAIQRMELAPLRDRIATELSGGEQARVLIARMLAQDAPLLLADEPIAGLDPAAQIGVMHAFSTVARGGGAVLVSLHDLGLAARHCTRLILLHQGRLIAQGSPSDVLTPSHLRDVFGVTAHFVDTPDGPVFQPLEVV